MTIQELKEQIKNLPDTFEVQVYTSNNSILSVEKGAVIFSEYIDVGSFILETLKINLVD